MQVSKSSLRYRWTRFATDGLGTRLRPWWYMRFIATNPSMAMEYKESKTRCPYFWETSLSPLLFTGTLFLMLLLFVVGTTAYVFWHLLRIALGQPMAVAWSTGATIQRTITHRPKHAPTSLAKWLIAYKRRHCYDIEYTP